jgi:hypothetical protein
VAGFGGTASNPFIIFLILILLILGLMCGTCFS